jgi:succinate-semialdehyde dehydrogenase/glutarate-semialdehyde dehydrogenase
MAYISKNPATEEMLAEFPDMTDADVDRKLAVAADTFAQWCKTDVAFRAVRMKKLAEIFRADARRYAAMITAEMGRPILGAVAEMEKSAATCEWYAENAEKILAPEPVVAEASESFVRFDPLGIIFAVMPWNFPFWQVIRFAAPALMAGNVGIMKHASNVPQCALLLEAAFGQAGFPEGAFQNIFVEPERTARIIRDPRVAAVTLTGSERAGRSVGALAGDAIKKTVLELGGSDPFIVLADASVEDACAVGVMARLQNAGQSCIAAKRFILVKEIAAQFIECYTKKYEALRIGDPLLEETDVGPLASEKMLLGLEQQVNESVRKGARVVIGGRRKEGKGYFYEPTILSDVVPGMPAYEEELFGPVASIIIAADTDDAIRIANDTQFGLGASLWTRNIAEGKKLAARIEAGAVFINGMVKSDPRLPFGGVKRSGYGRELGGYGMKEFINIKTVWIK